MEIEEVLKNALQARVRQVKQDPSITLDFKNGRLSQHVATDQQAQVVVLDATGSAANHFGRELNSNGHQIVRGSISIQTGYGRAVAVMDNALSNGTQPKEIIG